MHYLATQHILNAGEEGRTGDGGSRREEREEKQRRWAVVWGEGGTSEEMKGRWE